MSKIGPTEVTKIAQLSRLALSAEQTSDIAIELSNIMQFVEQLASVNTDDIELTTQVTGLSDVWRADVLAGDAISREQLLANAPATLDGYIKVGRVM